MKFQVEIPDEMFWKAAERAEMHDQKVHEFTADILLAVVAAPIVPETDPLVRLWRAGMSDSEIARTLGRTNLSVSTRRRSYKLPPNRRNVLS